jgi:HlyD family secretion protein
MDIARPDLLQKRKRRLVAYVIAAVAVMGVGLIAVYRLKPAAPPVDRSTIWPVTVKRGPMIRQVRGSTGSLVPREDSIELIPAQTDATVVRIRVLPGAKVTPDTDPDGPGRSSSFSRSCSTRSWRLRPRRPTTRSLQATLQSTLMDKKAAAAQVNSDYTQDQLQAQTDKALYDLGVISGLAYTQVQRVRQSS